MTELPDVSEWLTYTPRFIDPTLSTGLWFFDNVLDVSAVQINACCLPIAGDWADIDKCAEFFGAFPYLVIAIPDERHRAEAVEQLRRRLRSIPITVVQTAGFQGKTIPEIMSNCDVHNIWRLLGDCVDLPGFGLLNLSDVERPGPMPRICSPIAELDRATGGFQDGDLSIWTAKRGEGKSTILGQVSLRFRQRHLYGIRL